MASSLWPPLGGCRDHRRDQVEQLPAAQRIVDDVDVMRAHSVAAAQRILGYVVDVEHRAIAHVPRQ